MNESDPFQVTRDEAWEPTKDAVPAARIERIGRYRIERALGRGGFGIVYLAFDEQLNRRVAIKVPHANLISRRVNVDFYLSEARTVANLDHPGIVPVHDVGGTSDFPCYIVSKYIDGGDLAATLKERRPTYDEAARLVSAVADALHYAHKQGFVHRDIKPGNILIDSHNVPYVVDFGLALSEENIGEGPKYAGTPAYMSPEQARGEGHRVDGRSDIFSLGVVLYELLSGRHPFCGDTKEEVLEQVTSFEPRPLRQHDDNIPKELERICQKAMSKRASERYSTARDFADDLKLFLQEHTEFQDRPPQPLANEVAGETWQSMPPSTPATAGEKAPGSGSASLNTSDQRPIKIVPKGLRSFDSHDADFFLELLPGPKDRDGLPESIRFWKTRIEEKDPYDTFSVGLIYGPSGCGKSSLVKAGLLPRLSPDIVSVYVEATPEETETRLLHRLRKRFPSLEENLSLKDTLTALRRGAGLPFGKKVLVILDQFEQWLHTRKGGENNELLQALRQCDGSRLQCILMVRDDFWMAVTRFMRELEIRLLEGENSAAVDLFPVRHAEKVMYALGRAFGAISDQAGQITKDQRIFVNQTVADLAQDGKVICVRLALFAEMMKGKKWTPATLRSVGGTTGVGVNFLDETFAAPTAPPEHRYHQKAVRKVLNALLNDSGSNIKGHMRSHAELLEASGYANRPDEFDDLIRILDNEVRLITPTDPEGLEEEHVAKVDAAQKHYQLTHDYLVHSLRDWLTRKQRETRRGRAEMRLQELSSAFSERPDRRNLPSLMEYVNILLLTSRRRRTDPEKKVLQHAARMYAVRSGTTLSMALTIWFILQWQISRQHQRNLLNSTSTVVDALQTSTGETVPSALRNLDELPSELVVAELKERYHTAVGQPKRTIAYALARLGDVDREFLVQTVSAAKPEECPNIITALANSKDDALIALVEAIALAETAEDWVYQARLSIVAMHLGNVRPAAEMLRFDSRPNRIQRTVFIDTFPSWHGDLGDLAVRLQHAENAAICSGLSLALGSIQPVDDTLLQHWQDVLAEWYVHRSDAGTHGATGWALRRWNCELPNIQVANTLDAGHEWLMTESGLTLVRIPAGEFVRAASTTVDQTIPAEQTVKLTHDYYLSDREINVGLFEQFMEDPSTLGSKPANWPGPAKTISASPAHPVQQVHWLDAVMFCNWLSEREGLEPCYAEPKQEEARQNAGDEIDSDNWVLNPLANGYRLPSEAEWEYACRAGSNTAFEFGDDETRLADYAVYVENSAHHAAVCGSKKCNAWGLFDMHGNVFEWCHDWSREYGPDEVVVDPFGLRRLPTGLTRDRAARGGCCTYAAEYCRSSRRYAYFEMRRYAPLGFRVARTTAPTSGLAP